MTFKAPCDVIVDAIEDNEKRRLVDDLLFYTINTTGANPSSCAKRLASMTVAELKARQASANRHCNQLYRDQ